MRSLSCRRFLERCLVTGPLALAIVLAPVGAQAPAAAAPATAQESRNVYLAGSTVRLAEPVDGDLVAAGGRVIADKPVKGDATLFGGSVDVRIAVKGDEAFVEFRSDQAQARKLLLDAMPQLKELLAGEGLMLSGGFVGHSAQDPAAGSRPGRPAGVRTASVPVQEVPALPAAPLPFVAGLSAGCTAQAVALEQGNRTRTGNTAGAAAK